MDRGYWFAFNIMPFWIMALPSWRNAPDDRKSPWSSQYRDRASTKDPGGTSPPERQVRPVYFETMQIPEMVKNYSLSRTKTHIPCRDMCMTSTEVDVPGFSQFFMAFRYDSFDFVESFS